MTRLPSPDFDDAVDLGGDGSDELYDRVEFWYNRQGQRIQMKDQNETVHIYSYDSLGRLISDEIDSFGDDVDTAVARIDRAYEVRGMLGTVTSYDGSQTPVALNQVVLEYNGLGLPTVEYQEHSGLKDGSTLAVQYGCDDTAVDGELTRGMRPTSLTYPNGRVVSYFYDPDYGDSQLNRVTLIHDPNISPIANYEWTGVDQITLEILPCCTLDYQGWQSATYPALDRFDRVIDQPWIHQQSPLVHGARILYGYDRLGNRVHREDPIAAANNADLDELYTYDGVNRLKHFDRGDLTQDSTGQYAIASSARGEDWTLDPTGNWADYVQETAGTSDLEQSRSHNEANEIDDVTERQNDVAWITPAHDPAGNMTTVPKPSSLANGLTCKYDAWNRLVEVSDGEIIVGRYTYDGFNRRILRAYDSQSPAEPNGVDQYVHYFYNNKWQILETRETASSSAQAETLQPKYQYVWSLRYVDAPVLRDENTDEDNLCDDARIYFLNDANMNVIALVHPDGTVLERYHYDPYGRATIYDATWANTRAASLYNNPHLYTGRELDRETGLYCYRNRHYSPELGRFVSHDPIGHQNGPNAYVYVGSAPTIGTDPWGLTTTLTGSVPTSEYEWEKSGTEDYNVSRTFDHSVERFAWIGEGSSKCCYRYTEVHRSDFKFQGVKQFEKQFQKHIYLYQDTGVADQVGIQGMEIGVAGGMVVTVALAASGPVLPLVLVAAGIGMMLYGGYIWATNGQYVVNYGKDKWIATPAASRVKDCSGWFTNMYGLLNREDFTQVASSHCETADSVEQFSSIPTTIFIPKFASWNSWEGSCDGIENFMSSHLPPYEG